MLRSVETIDLRAIFRTTFIAAVVCLLGGYLLFQARFLLAGPSITLTHELQPVYNERIVVVSGSTQNITSITLNGREIFTDEAGNFQEPLVLENGYTIMYLHAEDRYGRETAVERTLVYRPASSINL